MNWATIAPESRLYKGKNLFRWEVSPGLEHHCGTCATPLHNSRAKTTCIGKHVEPCYRFHQQLHFVGKSHECFGCNSSDEMHHNRHKEILRIVRQISAHDQTNTALAIDIPYGGGKSRRSSGATISTNSITDTSSECPSTGTDGSPMTRRERKKAKKTGNAGVKDKKNSVESFPQEELDFVSEAIHLSIHESKGGWEGMYVYDYNPVQAEVEESVADDDQDQITYEEAEDVTNTFHHLAVKPPGDLTPRQRRVVKKFTTPVGHTNFRGGSRKFSPAAPFGKEDLYDGVDPNIFFRLNVEIVNPARNSKSRKELITKLVAAIKEDIEVIDREEKESAMREEGFWRWAGKSAYHAIQETRINFDWATGQKKGTLRYEPFLGEAGSPEPETPIGALDTDSEINPTPRASEIPNKPEQFYTKQVIVIEEAWETVGMKNNKNKKQPAKKYKTIKTSPKILITEEDGAEDTHEMVRRHQQRLAGKTIITKTDFTPTRKPLGRLTLTIK